MSRPTTADLKVSTTYVVHAQSEPDAPTQTVSSADLQVSRTWCRPSDAVRSADLQVGRSSVNQRDACGKYDLMRER